MWALQCHYGMSQRGKYNMLLNLGYDFSQIVAIANGVGHTKKAPTNSSSRRSRNPKGRPPPLKTVSAMPCRTFISLRTDDGEDEEDDDESGLEIQRRPTLDTQVSALTTTSVRCANEHVQN